jgi:polyisoprenoid-binding protein YceI
MGFSTLFGMFGQPSGTLMIDPKEPAKAKLDVTFPMSGLTVTSEKFATHLAGPEFLDAAKHPTATYKSRVVAPAGEKATIEGDLTLHGVTKPVTLTASFHGAGINPMTKAETIGFSATTKIKRSDFGLGAFAPVVSDEVEVTIVGAFEK